MSKKAFTFIASAIGAWVVVSFGGCVAPVPLVESDDRQAWAGRVDGREVIIKQVEKNWYMPIVVSPEGPAKLRTSGFRYIYYWVRGDSNKSTQLPFLELKTESAIGQWQEFVPIEGTALLLAMRVVETGWNPERPSELVRVRFEIAVFDAGGLRHRRILEAAVEEGQGHQGSWNHIRPRDGGRYLDYLSATGPRRYSTFDDRDGPKLATK